MKFSQQTINELLKTIKQTDIEKLAELADNLDAKGHFEAADKIDDLINRKQNKGRKLAQHIRARY